MKIRNGVTGIIAAILFAALPSKAQTYEVTCPAGTSSLQFMQTFDNVTGKSRQNFCVDASGNLSSTFIVGFTGTPTFIPYFATPTTFGTSIFLYDPTDTSQTVCLLPITNCIDLGTSQDGSAFYTYGSDLLQGAIMSGINDRTNNSWQEASLFRTLSNVELEPTDMGIFTLEHSGSTTTGGNCFLGGAASLSCAVGFVTDVGDDVVSRNPNANVQDAVGFHAQMSFNRSTPAHLGNVAAFFMATPGNCAATGVGNRPCAGAGENAVNLWGMEIQDLQGRGTTQTAGIHIEPQTNPAAGNFAIKVETGGGPSSFDTLRTAANCSSSASPAVCGSAAAGSVVVAAGVTTVVVNTTAVTASSQIFLIEDDSLGTKLGVTCNTGLAANVLKTTARVAGTSFTVTSSVNPVTNPECLSYFIVN